MHLRPPCWWWGFVRRSPPHGGGTAGGAVRLGGLRRGRDREFDRSTGWQRADDLLSAFRWEGRRGAVRGFFQKKAPAKRLSASCVQAGSKRRPDGRLIITLRAAI